MGVSDRGGAGPTREALEAQHREHLERHRRGVPEPIDIGDVTALSKERIAELGQIHGHAAVSAAIAQAGMAHLATVRIVLDEPPSMYERFREIDSAPELTASDRRELKSDALRRHGHRMHAHEEFRRRSLNNLFEMIAQVVGEDRIREVVNRLGLDACNAILATPKHKRRAALARAMEELPDE